jgi:hypothetical protein
MSTGMALAVVALAVALVIAGLFRLLAVLDSVELSLRRLVAEMRATRKEVRTAGELAAAVERDAARSRAEIGRAHV